MVNHEYHTQRLSRIPSFAQVWKDKYFQEFFVKRYAWNLPLASFELFGEELTYQQIEVWQEYLKSGGFKGGRLLVPSGHGTGKSNLTGKISTLHLLCYEYSITRLQAPTLSQITSSIFKEINSALDGLNKTRIIKGKRYTPKWGFLSKFFQVNKTKIYVKGNETSWYIEARTAPKGSSTNLSGQHQYNYLLIMDEASGIEDEHIEAGLGALTETFNSIILFSQHTVLSGKFHEFVTTKTIDKGGSWCIKRLSSRHSSRVSDKQLLQMLNTYSEEEIRVRIDGLPPKLDTDVLIQNDEVMKCYNNKNSAIKYNQIVFSYDLGYTGYRDSSVLVIAEAYTYINEATDKEVLHTKLKEIYKYDGFNGKLPIDFIETVFTHILTYLDEKSEDGIYYDAVYVIGDATAGGYEAYVKLEDMLLELQTYNIIVKGLQWGSEKLYFEDKKRFINARAKAFVNLKENIVSDRFLIETNNYENRVKKELSQIYFTFTNTFKYKILSKQDLKSKKGLSSPDIADCCAQIMLVKFEVFETRSKIENINNVNSEIEDYFDEDIIDGEIVEYNENKVISIDADVPTLITLDDEF
jgi:hypothetical protein